MAAQSTSTETKKGRAVVNMRAKLPRWIPQTPKPWNPAYIPTWEAMTENERRWSFLFDLVVCALFVGALYTFNLFI